MAASKEIADQVRGKQKIKDLENSSGTPALQYGTQEAHAAIQAFQRAAQAKEANRQRELAVLQEIKDVNQKMLRAIEKSEPVNVKEISL